MKNLQKSLEFVEVALKSDTKKFLGRNSDPEFPGMIDYMIWPWFERMDVISYLLPSEQLLPRKQFQHTVNIFPIEA